MTDIHLTDCTGNGSVDCFYCGGDGSYCGCDLDCYESADCDYQVRCAYCHGSGFFRCPACSESWPQEDCES